MGCINSTADAGVASGAAVKLNENYTMGGKLGEGGYSIVNLATHKTTKEQVAVKIVKRKNIDMEDEEALRQEVAILKELDHPSVTKLFDYYEETANFYLVMEYLDGGELFDRIVKKTIYTEKEARDLVFILLSAIKYLHDKDIIHRDLKPENLLLKSKGDDGDVKLADFGFAVKCEGDNITSQCGTPGYIAPEILRKKSYGKSVDMWSFGVILFILLGGYPPFIDDNQVQLFRKICRAEYQFHPEYWAGVSSEAKHLIQGLLTLDVKKRLTVDQALAHKWMGKSATELQSTKLDAQQKQLKSHLTRQKFKKAAHAVMAANKFKRMMNFARQLDKMEIEEDNEDVTRPAETA